MYQLLAPTILIIEISVDLAVIVILIVLDIMNKATITKPTIKTDPAFCIVFNVVTILCVESPP